MRLSPIPTLLHTELTITHIDGTWLVVLLKFMQQNSIANNTMAQRVNAQI